MRVWCSRRRDRPVRLHEGLRKAIGHRVAGVFVERVERRRAARSSGSSSRFATHASRRRCAWSMRYQPSLDVYASIQAFASPPALLTAARTEFATLPSSAMRRHASHWAFRPTSRSSQKLCSRWSTSRSASSNFFAATSAPQCARSARFLEAERVDRSEALGLEPSRCEARARPPLDRPSPDRPRRSSCEADGRALAPRLPRPSSSAPVRRRGSSAERSSDRSGTHLRERSEA